MKTIDMTIAKRIFSPHLWPILQMRIADDPANTL